jgi:transcriptional regulator with AAA-type ATPase domain
MTSLDTTVTVIDAAARAHVPVLLWSDPGMGKSSVVRALAASDQVPVETVIGSQREPVDIAGWPVVTDGAVQTLALPDWADTLIKANGGYLLLDELTTSSASTQAAMLTVALERGRSDQAARRGADRGRSQPPDRAAGGVDLTRRWRTGSCTSTLSRRLVVDGDAVIVRHPACHARRRR